MRIRLRQLLARWAAFRKAGELDRDFQLELESHVALAADEHVRRGLSAADARRAALRRMGSPSSLEAQHRDTRGLPELADLLMDLRFAARLMHRAPWFSAAAIAVLALGIAVTTVGFTVVNGAFLRGLPFDEADRLLTVSWINQQERRVRLSADELADLAAAVTSFEGLAAFRSAEVSVSDDRALPEQRRGAEVSASAFALLRQPLHLGRGFLPDEGRPGAATVVVLGHGLWQTRYAGDAAVLGQTLRVNGRPATIVGVMPEGMAFPDNADLWMPLTVLRGDERSHTVFGRLRPGIDPRQAQAEVTAAARPLRDARDQPTRDLAGIRLESFTQAFVGGAARPTFLAIMGAGILVLLIACANIANLLLSRSIHRAREVALRTAMGATRARVLRQLLVESLVLSLLGGGLGLALAVVGVQTLQAAMPADMPYWIAFTVDARVFGYVAVVCVLTTMLFGLAPALHVARTDSHASLKDGRGLSGTRRVRRFSGAMVVAEFTLTLVLLSGAGLMLRSFLTLYAIDLGFDSRQLLTMQIALPDARYASADARRRFFAQLEPRLTALPGVQSVAVTTGVPPLDGGERLLEVDRGAVEPRPAFVSTVSISPAFFDVVGVPVARGRAFTDLDGAAGSESVIVNERLASRFFPGEEAIGRRLRFAQRNPTPGAPTDTWRTIVGISGRILHGSPQDAYESDVVYLPYRQDAPAAASLLVRSALEPGSVMDAVRREVRAIDQDQPVYTMRTLDQVVADSRWAYRTFGTLFGIFAGIGLLLSGLGLYAVVAYAVTQRTQEIGVRMAVGARRGQVVWLVLRRGLRQVAVALLLGIPGSLALGFVLPQQLVAEASGGVVTFAAIGGVLAMVCFAACLVPARRAMRLDPLEALRVE